MSGDSCPGRKRGTRELLRAIGRKLLQRDAVPLLKKVRWVGNFKTIHQRNFETRSACSRITRALSSVGVPVGSPL